MFQIGDKVVYGIHGICSVVEEEKRRVDGKNVVYLALEPVGQAGSRFLVPTHNQAAMAKLRYLLDKEAAENLLCLNGVSLEPWIPEENRRKQAYRELIAGGDCQKLMSAVWMITQHRQRQSAAGRKLHMCDDNFMRDAQRLLVMELAAVLERPQEEIKQTLLENLMKME